AQIFDTHHAAMLLAAGTTAVSPFLAMQLAEEHKPEGAASYCYALETGLKKVLSRMGISTLASYRNGHLFETVGLHDRLCEEFFESGAHFTGAITLQQVLEDYLHNHALAYSSEHTVLKDSGFYRYRKEGEQHETSPDLLRKLHVVVQP